MTDYCISLKRHVPKDVTIHATLQSSGLSPVMILPTERRAVVEISDTRVEQLRSDLAETCWVVPVAEGTVDL